jgi:hypothetical protein
MGAKMAPKKSFGCGEGMMLLQPVVSYSLITLPHEDKNLQRSPFRGLRLQSFALIT